MKRHFLTVLNTTAVIAGLDAVNGIFSTFSLGEGEKSKRFRYVAKGEYPQVLPDGRQIVQVVDDKSIEMMISNFRTTGLDTFFRGVPIYEGHADDEGWSRANPGHKPKAVGRIKKMEAGEDGLYVEAVYNAEGVALLSGEAPAYSGHSARWRMQPIDGRPNHYRPVLLWSDALTNSPNIPGSTIALNQSPNPAAGASGTENTTQDQDMKLTEANLRRLGLSADATEDALNSAIDRLLSEKDTAAADLVTANSAKTAAESEVTRLKGELETLNSTRVVDAVNSAVASGRITEADKPKWEGILKADFANGSAILAGMQPVTALNTRSQLPPMRGRAGETADMTGGIDAMNAATRAFAQANGIDISTEAGWTRAFEGAKAAKPEIFARNAAKQA